MPTGCTTSITLFVQAKPRDRKRYLMYFALGCQMWLVEILQSVGRQHIRGSNIGPALSPDRKRRKVKQNTGDKLPALAVFRTTRYREGARRRVTYDVVLSKSPASYQESMSKTACQFRSRRDCLLGYCMPRRSGRSGLISSHITCRGCAPYR